MSNPFTKGYCDLSFLDSLVLFAAFIVIFLIVVNGVHYYHKWFRR